MNNESAREVIDLEKWPRKTHFQYFDRAVYPYIDVTVQTDITVFLEAVKARGLKFFPGLLYCFVRAVNEIEEFKYRIVNDQVVKFERIDGDITVPIEGERFAFCRMEYRKNIHEFIQRVETAQEETKRQKELIPNDWYDVVWVSANPWFSFASMTAPIVERKMRSIPLILVGKYYECGSKTLLPLSIKVNHALLDGLHIGKFLNHCENAFRNPDLMFS